MVNFVSTPDLRGAMLVKTTVTLQRGGMLFLVLPLACVNNSRYFDVAALSDILSALGYSIKHSHSSPKLYFVMAVLDSDPKKWEGCFPKKHVRDGKDRNNFHIIL